MGRQNTSVWSYILPDEIVIYRFLKILTNFYTVCTENVMLYQSNTMHGNLAALFKLNNDHNIDMC